MRKAVIVVVLLFSANPVLADDNCGDVKNEIQSRFRIARFGLCDHRVPASADDEAYRLLCPQVIGAGGAGAEAGHRTVSHWRWLEVKDPFGKVLAKTKIDEVNTYLSYCGGK